MEKMDANGAEELEALFPKVELVPIGNKKISVYELTPEEMAPLIDKFRPVLAGADAGDDLLTLFTKYRESAYAIISATTGIALPMVRRISAGKSIVLLQHSIAVNLDFFVQSVALATLIGSLMPPNAGRGATPSPTSSAAAT